MSAPAAITPEEVAAVLRQVAHGEIPITLVEPAHAWTDIYAGDVAFTAGGWRIVIFNDCMQLDYVDSATAPDGRRADFEDWHPPGAPHLACPLRHLTGIELDALERHVEAAR